MIWFWLIVAGISLLLELVTKSMVSVWFIGGALAAVVIALLGLAPYYQILMFIAVSLLLFGYFKNWAQTHILSPDSKYPTNADRLIGQVGKVTQTIRPFEGGRAEIAGMDWKAIGNHNETIPVGTEVKIVKISGVKLEVVPVIVDQERMS